MFDLNKQKKKGAVPEYEFDVEKDFKDPSKKKALKEQINTRVQQLKGALRQGDNKEFFDQAQTLLHGYLALQKVLERSQVNLKNTTR